MERPNRGRVEMSETRMRRGGGQRHRDTGWRERKMRRDDEKRRANRKQKEWR